MHNIPAVNVCADFRNLMFDFFSAFMLSERVRPKRVCGYPRSSLSLGGVLRLDVYPCRQRTHLGLQLRRWQRSGQADSVSLRQLRVPWTAHLNLRSQHSAEHSFYSINYR